jgi:ribosomal-protein-alanine N-acetyltransferase
LSSSSQIRSIRAEDASLIFSIIEEAHRTTSVPFGAAWSFKQVQEECGHGGLVLCGADSSSNKEILAFVLYRDVGEALEISFLATARNHLGKGYMAELLSSWLKQKPESKAIWLEVHEKNVPARKLYEKLGFRESGKRPRYYADGGAAVLYNYG